MNADTPLQVVVSRLANGSPATLAKILGVDKSTVSCWSSTKRRGQKVGQIPVKYWPALLDNAKSRGIDLDATDLLGTT